MISTIDDSISDINETVDISLTPSGGDITFCKNTLESSQIVAIVDDEAAPTITLAASASSIAENAGSSITLQQQVQLFLVQILPCHLILLALLQKEQITEQYLILLFQLVPLQVQQPSHLLMIVCMKHQQMRQQLLLLELYQEEGNRKWISISNINN